MFSKDTQSSNEASVNFELLVRSTSEVFVQFIGMMNLLSRDPIYNQEEDNISIVDALFGQMHLDKYKDIEPVKEHFIQAISAGIALNPEIIVTGNIGRVVDALTIFMDHINLFRLNAGEEFRLLFLNALSSQVVLSLLPNEPFAETRDDSFIYRVRNDMYKFFDEISNVKMCDVGYMNN